MSRTKELKAEKLQAENKIENYRQIERKSYSDLKMFAKDKKNYYYLKILKDPEAIEKDRKSKESSPYIRMGNLIDIKLTDPDNFDNLFIQTKANVPTGQMLTLVDFLFDFTVRDTDDKGRIISDFSNRFTEAYEALKEQNGGKLKSGEETFLTRFAVEGQDYFQEKLNSIGKTIITAEEEMKAEAIVESLRNSIGTREEVNWVDKVVKFPVLFEVDGVEMKGEIDQANFDHSNKTVTLFDYKCTSFIDSFIYDGYLNNSYYIQASLYWWAFQQWLLDSSEYKDYKVKDFGFIVCDSNNYQKPLIFFVGEHNMQKGFTGFKSGNRYFKGVIQLLEELDFSEKNNLWDMSVENFKNKGKVIIPNFESLEN